MTGKLEGAARAQALDRLAAAGWTHDAGRDAITKTFRFGNFRQAFGWMTEVALAAEKAGHHPEWCNVWNRVDVVLTTHDAGGLTALDVDMADLMDSLRG